MVPHSCIERDKTDLCLPYRRFACHCFTSCRPQHPLKGLAPSTQPLQVFKQANERVPEVTLCSSHPRISRRTQNSPAARMAGRPAAASYSLPPLWILSVLLTWSLCFGKVSARALADGASSNLTELQKHVSFFDRNKDGIITPLETFQGFVAVGCEIAFSSAAASTVHGALAPFTNPPGAPPPYVNIHVKYIHKAIHGSDTGAYDSKGRFVQEKFDEIFTKHAHIRQDALTLPEIEEMLTFNRDPFDPASWPAAEAEWQLIYQLAHDRYGFLTKKRARGIYDGSIFVELEERRKSLHSDA